MQVDVPTHIYCNVTPDAKSGWGRRSRPVVTVVDQLLSIPDQDKTSTNIVYILYVTYQKGIYRNVVFTVHVITLYQQS